MSFGTGFQPNCPRHPKENLKPEDIRSIRLICVQKFVQFEEGDSQIVLYQPNETISIEVKLDADYDTVWLTQAQMVELFASSKANISEHISNIFQQCELQPESTVRKFRIVRKEGARTVTRTIDHYNLDVIISVGFRVNSRQGRRVMTAGW